MDYTSIILNQLQESWDNSFAKQSLSIPNPAKILGQIEENLRQSFIKLDDENREILSQMKVLDEK